MTKLAKSVESNGVDQASGLICAPSGTDVETEVRARTMAVEASIRAQVEAQFNGYACHRSNDFIPHERHFMAGAAKHNYKSSDRFSGTSLALHSQQRRLRY